MNRKIAGLASLATVAATLGFAATAVPGAAQADPGLDHLPAVKGEPQLKPDNLPDPLSRKRAALRQRAVDALVTGDARTVGRGVDRAIKMADGTLVDYPTSQTAQLLTFLLEFGDGASNPAFPDNTEGPLHNEIPEPPPIDNTTYWLPDFNRQHFMDMFFNGLADQNGESFRNLYTEMSSGRFRLEGDVSDWVKVPNAASYYSDAAGENPGSLMTEFLEDGATAWYNDQLADGKTAAQIKDYLATFDVWDRFDFDSDGDVNEPDGYIDHFQAIHAGEDESAGAAPWAIWAHRSSVNQNADVGPEGNKNGGVQIGDSGLWIRDYTTEPENGGLGVFAHEFAHDLGVPDYYDTQEGGDNSTGFWTLMSQGSWLGHGAGTIGTTPNHMGAPDKLFLGWYGPDELAIVDGTGAPEEVDLGPSYHATDAGAQAVAVTLPQGSAVTEVVEPEGPGTHYFYSGNGDERVATVTSPAVTVPAGDPTLSARVSFSIEDDWDYAYLKVSDDGGETWTYVETNLSTDLDPNQQNAGYGITGCSGTRDSVGVCDNAWTDLTADLTAWAGAEVMLQFEMFNDAAYYELGFSVDNIALGGTVVTDVEPGAPDWTLDGFRVMDGSTFTDVYDQYYLAENRQPLGYDKTMVEGPYSADYPVSAPGQKVDHFRYEDGLLVWYANGRYGNNDVSDHPGGGQALPVDSNPAYTLWERPNGTPYAYADGNLNSYDATFDVDEAEGLHLTSEAGGGVHFDVEAHETVPVFDDSDPEAYWDDTYQDSTWYSTKVAGVGAMIQVLSSDEATGQMTVKAGRKFVAVTTQPSIAGTPAVGETLTAVAPEFFQDGVAVSYQWQVDGKPIWGETGATYQVKTADAGKTVSVVVTGAKADYLPGKATASVSVALQAAPVATTAPVITGTPQVGKQLGVTPATWDAAGASTFAWMAGDTVIGTGGTYVLKPADAGSIITVRETRTANGRQPGAASSAATGPVEPATVTISVDAPTKVKRGKKPTITVTVSSPGLVPPGTIQVTYDGEPVADQTLTAGKVTFRLPKQSDRGKKKLVVSYVPSVIGFTAASTTVKIRITR